MQYVVHKTFSCSYGCATFVSEFSLIFMVIDNSLVRLGTIYHNKTKLTEFLSQIIQYVKYYTAITTLFSIRSL